jgi:hypothetical protein
MSRKSENYQFFGTDVEGNEITCVENVIVGGDNFYISGFHLGVDHIGWARPNVTLKCEFVGNILGGMRYVKLLHRKIVYESNFNGNALRIIEDSYLYRDD